MQRIPPVWIKRGVWTLAIIVVIGGVTLSLPSILIFTTEHRQNQDFLAMSDQFPVTVDPQNKVIAEDPRVNIFLDNPNSPFQAAAGNASNIFNMVFTWIAVTVSDASWYQSLAAVTIGDNRLVSVTPGMRKEQVALVFTRALNWNAKQQKEFLNASSPDTPVPFLEGSFAPGVYSVAGDTTPQAARALIAKRFTADILDHYGTTTAEAVPLDQAITIASLIEREAGGPDDMRLISGIIWNRLFVNMRLQIDATLQYAKANTATAISWWPGVVPRDQFRASPYNTYLHPGLPPTPIANPSVAAILAALNPKSTSCLFYFHDAQKQFHCSDTYAEHVALLKQHYGRGK